MAYQARGKHEVVVVKLERCGSDVNPEESGWIPKKYLHAGIQSQHIRWYSTPIHPCLHVEALEYNVLQPPPHNN